MKNALPKGVVALGLVSLFMDMSSEMIHALLPLYLTGTLGASALMLGLIEGAGEATAQITKLFSGQISDRLGRRKPLALAGYGLSAVTKPLFALAGGPGMVLVARLSDRVGKGIRGAPRDALVADLVPPEQRGAAYGLRQTLDTVGAIAGPALAMGFMLLLADVRAVFVVATIPAVLAVLVLAIWVREPARHAPPPPRVRLGRASLAAMGPGLWRAVALGSVMTLARFSEGFLILRAGDAGIGMAWAPVVMVVMNLVYAASAWPVGSLSDRIGKSGLLTLGFAALVLADLVLALAATPLALLVGVMLWGLHMGLTQGLLSAMVADAAPKELRGTAFGVFSLVTGAALLLGNALAGELWAAYGGGATFAAGAVLALISLIGALFRKGKPRGKPR